jgi:hypothetical protein
MTSLFPPTAPGAVQALPFSRVPRAALAAFVLALVALVSAFAPRLAAAAGDPAGCTETVQYDPSIPTFTQFATEKGFANPTLGGFGSGAANRHISSQLYEYEEAVAAATANNPRVRVLVRDIGPTRGESAPEQHRKFQYSIVGTPQNIANVETDAAWYRDVRAGRISKDAALADFRANHRPAMAWITETPHGNEPAGGEASIRTLYELAARTDCANMARLRALDTFIDPSRNPDGRDNNTRTTAWAFDPNRDLMYETQDVNQAPMDEFFKYPGLFFIDAHQQTNGYFFPPNEDPVHHEISHFALDEIQEVIGPALQSRFNDQSLQYRNYNAYDLFTPEYGDAVPALLLGSAGMTYEKGSSENYGKQVYDHYLAMDETVTVVAAEKDQLVEGWIEQWQEAAEQGANCDLQDNVLVSPLHETIEEQPDIGICGYYFKPGNHSGDTAHVIELLRDRDVHVYRLDQSVEVTGAHDWGKATTTTTLPAGTLWIPTAQTMKHWIGAVLEEKPFQPYAYFYDVVDWSFPELNDLAGDGQLQSQLPNVPMTEVTGELRLGTVTGGEKPVLAFSTDSTHALGLVTKLLAQGATVFRAKDAFDAGGTHFPTGAALVDASTLGNIDLPSLAAAAQTAVTGLDAFPAVPRFAIAKPKIAVFTGNAVLPTNPLFKNGGSGHCTVVGFCEMLYTLAEADGIPVSLLTPVTTTDLSNGVLTAGNFTALVSANATLSAAGTPISPATALAQFVKAGGNYVVYGSGGASSARNAGVSLLNTASTATWNQHCADNLNPAAAGELTTPGTAFSASFNTANPVAWGFDEGGYVYRDVSSTNTAPIFDPTSLGGNLNAEPPGEIPPATAAVSYATNLTAFGYQCNGLEPDRLPGRPYVVDQPLRNGHAIVIGSNAYFRAWNTGAQRLVLNGILYPNTAPIGPGAPRVARALAKLKPAPGSRPLRVRSRPVRANHEKLADVVITVKRAKLPVLKRIVRHARLPRAVRRHMRWVAGPGRKQATLRILNASSFARREHGDSRIVKGSALWTFGDLELRPTWAWRIITGLTKHRLPHQRQI